MSRFTRGFIDQASDSESEEDYSSEEEEQNQNVGAAANKKVKGYGRDSDDESDEERVIKSGTEKIRDALNKALNDVQTAINNNDFNKMDASFEALVSEISKSRDKIFKEAGEKLPSSVLKVLDQLQESINEVTAATKKKMPKANAMSHTKLKQKFKKYIAAEGEGDMLYETQLEKYQEEPWESEEEKKDESEDDDDDEKNEDEDEEEEQYYDEEEENEDAKNAADQKKEDENKEKDDENADVDAMDSDDSFFDDPAGGDEDEESDDEKAIDVKNIDPKLKTKYAFLFKAREDLTPQERRWAWVKKEFYPGDLTQLIEALKKKKPSKKKTDNTAAKNKDAAEGEDNKEQDEFITKVNRRDDLEVDYTQIANVAKKLEELEEEKRYDAGFHFQVYQKMLEQMPCEDNQAVQHKISVLTNLVKTKLQVTDKDTIVSRDDWKQVVEFLNQLLDLSSQSFFQKRLQKAHDATKAQDDEEEKKEEEGEKDSYKIERSFFPTLTSSVEKMHQYLWKSFQKLKQQSIEYLQRIQDENLLLFLIDKSLAFIKDYDMEHLKVRIEIIKLTYLYYKHDSVYTKIIERIQGKGDNVESRIKGFYTVQDSEAMVSQLVDSILVNSSKEMRVKATLCQAYHHALHNRVRKARDLIMKSHIGQIIKDYKVDNQILYNRAITQTGMAAFRLGDIKLSHEILIEIYQNTRFKELLGQGVSKNLDKTPEQDQEEKRRLIPHHMAISLQVLESMHYITSMLIEIPMMSENQLSMKKTFVSKHYRRLIDQYDNKQAFVLAAEQSRDHIVFAARALNKSDWRTALKHVFSIGPLVRLPEFESGTLQETLSKAFKDAALTAFLFNAAKQYKSFCLDSLSSIFELEKRQVKKTVSQLIIQNRLQANLDYENDLLLLQADDNDIKELQQLSLQYVSQIRNMVVHNEKIVEILDYHQHFANRNKNPRQ